MDNQTAVWRSGPLFPQLPQTTSLEVYDVRSLSFEERLSVSSLVGLVNRGASRLYLLENDDDLFWLNRLDTSIPREKPALTSGDLLTHLLTARRQLLQGLVIYDPALPDSVNVATTLASLRAALVVSPAQAERLQTDPFALPVLADLRTYGWKTRLQAYAWAYRELLPQCSHEMVAGLGPDLVGGLRPFLVTHRVFVYWLDSSKPFWSFDTARMEESALFKRIMVSFVPGALHLGWYIHEPSGVRLTSEAALCTFASDHCTNLEVWSNMPAPPAPAAPQPARTPQVLSTKTPQGRRPIYLSFTISDGDNLQYCQHRLLHLWNDRARGSLPLGWTLTPALAEALPYQAAFYQQSASACDEFIAGPSGLAYLFPSSLPLAQQEAFIQSTRASMQAMNLELLQVLDSSSLSGMRLNNPSLQALFVEHLGASGLRGIFSGFGSWLPGWHQHTGLPIYRNLGLAISPARTRFLIKLAAACGVRYINIYVFAWKLTPGDLQAIVKELGERFVVVTPGQLLERLQQAD